MNRAAKWLVLILVAVATAACGSSSKSTSGSDTTTSNDTTTPGDTTTPSDTTLPSDTNTGNDIFVLGDLVLPDTNTTPDTSRTQTDLSCYRILACQDACGASRACAGGCLDNGSADGKAKYQAVGVCQNTNCTGLSGDALANCVATKCKTEFEACLEPVKYGTGSCVGLIQCIGNTSKPCIDSQGNTDIACLYDCMEATKKTSIDKYKAVEACGEQKCGNETTQQGFQTCLTSNCGTELTACQTDQ